MSLTLIQRSTLIYEILYSLEIRDIKTSLDKMNPVLRVLSKPSIEWKNVIVAIFSDDPPVPQQSAYAEIIESIETAKLELGVLFSEKNREHIENEKIKLRLDDIKRSSEISRISNEKEREHLLRLNADQGGASTDPVEAEIPTYKEALDDSDRSSTEAVQRFYNERQLRRQEIEKLEMAHKLLNDQVAELNKNRIYLLAMLDEGQTITSSHNITNAFAGSVENINHKLECQLLRRAIILNIQAVGENVILARVVFPEDPQFPIFFTFKAFYMVLAFILMPTSVMLVADFFDNKVIGFCFFLARMNIVLILLLFPLVLDRMYNIWSEYKLNPALMGRVLKTNLLIAAVALMVMLTLYFFAMPAIASAMKISLSGSKLLFALLCQFIFYISVVSSEILRCRFFKSESKSDYCESESYVKNNLNFRVTEAHWDKLVSQGFDRDILTEVFRLLADDFVRLQTWCGGSLYFFRPRPESISLFCSLRDGRCSKIVDGDLTIAGRVFRVGGPTAQNLDSETNVGDVDAPPPYDFNSEYLDLMPQV